MDGKYIEGCKSRKGILAWAACNKVNKIWKSELDQKLEICLSRATVETVLLHGSETWIVTKALARELNGSYTRILRVALNVSWQSHTINFVLYEELPQITETIAERRLRLAAHCVRHRELEASKLISLTPTDEKPNRERKQITFIDVLKEDLEVESTDEIKALMIDRTRWKSVVSSVPMGV